MPIVFNEGNFHRGNFQVEGVGKTLDLQKWMDTYKHTFQNMHHST